MKLPRFVLVAMIVALVASTTAAALAVEPLSATFSSDAMTGAAPLTVHFTDQSAGSPTEWHWNFGDDTYSTRQDPTHTFQTPGTYNVTLTITDGYESSTTSSEITVTAAPKATPQPIYVIPVRPGHPDRPVVDKPGHHDQPKIDKPKQPEKPKADKPGKAPVKDPGRNDNGKKRK